MYIPKEKISEILNTSDIVDIVSESVILKKSGQNYFGLCPFHSEKTPSFSVNPNKQIFHCFGCSAGGSALTFVMKYHGISFPEACRMLARKYNITIEDEQLSPAKMQAIQLKEGLFRLNKQIMEYYTQQLISSDEAEKARGYLKKRGISDDTIQKFMIGYSLDGWESVVREFKKYKISDALAVQSGLVLKRQQKTGHYDRFRNRIMFPIFDINMQVAGFGGRVMDDSMPKYMNSPETPVYHKGRILYGLHAAKQHCRHKGVLHIVEGYFDFISLYQNGVKNTVATLGTALTPDHVRILKGYASRIILVFDSDAAGINAAKRSLKLFVKEGIDTRILVLPEGNDPDSYIVEHGKDAFENLASKAKTMIQFLLQVAIDTHGLSVEGRVRVLNDIKPNLSMIQDSAARSLYIKDVAETLNIDEKAVLEKVREQHVAGTRDTGQLLPDENQEQQLSSDPREMQVISLILNYPEIIKEVKAKEIFSYFYSDKLKKLGQKILKIEPDENGFVNRVMASIDNDADQQLIASCAMDDEFEQENIHQTAVSILNRVIKIRKKQENTLKEKITSAEKGSDSELMELLKQKQAEIRQLHEH